MSVNVQPSPSLDQKKNINITEALIGRSSLRQPRRIQKIEKKEYGPVQIGISKEEKELIESAQNGSKEAAEFLINKYQVFIDKMIMSCGKALSDENRNSARIGFWIGLLKYDLSRNVTLRTYITFWIRAAIYRANRLLTNEVRLKQSTWSYDSVENPDILLGYKCELHEELEIREFLNSLGLSEIDRQILEMRLAGYTLKEIAHTFDVTIEAIRRKIEKHAFSKNFLSSYGYYLNSPKYQKEVTQILQMVERGVSISEIGKSLSISAAKVKRDLLIVSCAKDFFTHLTINKIQKMLTSGHNVDEIVKELNVPRGMVVRYQRLLLAELGKICKG